MLQEEEEQASERDEESESEGESEGGQEEEVREWTHYPVPGCPCLLHLIAIRMSWE